MDLKKGFRGWWIVLLVLAADRITKMAAVALEDAVVLIPGVFNARYVENTGIAFSLLSGGGIIVAIITWVMLMIIMAFLMMWPQESWAFRTGLWMAVGGGMGNLYDRLAYGHVIDFLETDFMRFPVFNVADICICVGAVGAVVALAIEEIRIEIRKGKKDGK